MAGDAAATAVLKVIESRVRLLGLVQPSGARAGRCEQTPTVVLQKADCRLSGCPYHT